MYIFVQSCQSTRLDFNVSVWPGLILKDDCCLQAPSLGISNNSNHEKYRGATPGNKMVTSEDACVVTTSTCPSGPHTVTFAQDGMVCNLGAAQV